MIEIYATDAAFAALKGNGSVVTWGDARNGVRPGGAVTIEDAGRIVIGQVSQPWSQVICLGFRKSLLPPQPLLQSDLMVEWLLGVQGMLEATVAQCRISCEMCILAVSLNDRMFRSLKRNWQNL